MFLARFGEGQYELIGGLVCGWIWVDLVPLGSQGGQVTAGTCQGGAGCRGLRRVGGIVGWIQVLDKWRGGTW